MRNASTRNAADARRADAPMRYAAAADAQCCRCAMRNAADAQCIAAIPTVAGF